MHPGDSGAELSRRGGAEADYEEQGSSHAKPTPGNVA